MSNSYQEHKVWRTSNYFLMLIIFDRVSFSINYLLSARFQATSWLLFVPCVWVSLLWQLRRTLQRLLHSPIWYCFWCHFYPSHLYSVLCEYVYVRVRVCACVYTLQIKEKSFPFLIWYILVKINLPSCCFDTWTIYRRQSVLFLNKRTCQL